MATQGKKRLIASVMVALAIFATRLCVQWARALRQPQQPATWFTAQQVATNAAPICRLLSSDAGSLQQVIEQCTVSDHDGRQQTVFVVDAENTRGQTVVHSVWDAATGCLLSVAHIPRRGRSGQSPPTVTGKPADTACRWLELLGVAKQTRHWQVSKVTALDQRTWKVVLQSETQSATVLFDRNTDDLIDIAIQALDPAVDPR